MIKLQRLKTPVQLAEQESLDRFGQGGKGLRRNLEREAFFKRSIHDVPQCGQNRGAEGFGIARLFAFSAAEDTVPREKPDGLSLIHI